MLLFPVFPIRLLMIVLPLVIAGGVLAYAGTRGVSVFKKQGVAWGLTALMIAAAVGIGYGKAIASNDPIPDVPQSNPPVRETVPPNFQQGPGAFPSYVRDDAGVLSDRTARELYERNLRLYEDYGVVIGVITCNYGGDLYSYALRQGEEMGLTDYDFIVALDIRGDNYYLIGLEGYFTDEDCSDYAYRYMERDFARGNYDGAALSLTEALENWCNINFN